MIKGSMAIGKLIGAPAQRISFIEVDLIFFMKKRINPDKSISYIGRIINQKYADGFELRENTDGTYAMNKIKTDALIEDF